MQQPNPQLVAWIVSQQLSSTFSAMAALVALQLAQRMGASGRCHCTINRLARSLGRSESAVQRALAQLLAHPESPVRRFQAHSHAIPEFVALSSAPRGGEIDTQEQASLNEQKQRENSFMSSRRSATPAAVPAPSSAISIDLGPVEQAYRSRMDRDSSPGEVERAKSALALLLAADPQLTVDDVAAGILETTSAQMRGSDGRLWDDLPSLLRFPDRFRVQRERRQAAQDEFAREAAYVTEQTRVVAELGTPEQREELAQARSEEERCGLLARWQKERARAAWEAYRAGVAPSAQPEVRVEQRAWDGTEPTASAGTTPEEQRRRITKAGLAVCKAALGLSC